MQDEKINRYTSLHLEVSEGDDHYIANPVFSSHIVQQCLNLKQTLLNTKINETASKHIGRSKHHSMRVVAILSKVIQRC
jgi:hypothetical protein